MPQDPQQPVQEHADQATHADIAQEKRTLTWADLDTDGDGRLSRTEAANVDALVQAFDTADTDSDGQLTPEEYSAYVSSNQQTPPTGDDGE